MAAHGTLGIFDLSTSNCKSYAERAKQYFSKRYYRHKQTESCNGGRYWSYPVYYESCHLPIHLISDTAPTLMSTQAKLHTYTGEQITVMGAIEVPV